MDLRAAEDGFSRAAGAGSSRSGSFHLIQIVSRVCIIIRSALFWGQPPVSVGEYLAERKGDESRSADTNTRRIALFFMCSKTQCFCGGGGGFQRKHYPQNWSECSTVDLKFSSKYSTLFFYLLLGHPHCPWTHNYAADISFPPSVGHAPLHPQSFTLKVQRLHSRWEAAVSVQAEVPITGSGLEFSCAAPVTWYPFMITWNHMDGEDGREGAIRPGRQLLSWLKAVAEVWLTCPASAASPSAATLVTPKAGCGERHPSRGQSLADRGAVVIVSPEQLSHFAAPTECLTCFSASIGHISQGEAGVVDTDGSDLHAIDALNIGEWRYLS